MAVAGASWAVEVDAPHEADQGQAGADSWVSEVLEEEGHSAVVETVDSADEQAWEAAAGTSQ